MLKKNKTKRNKIITGEDFNRIILNNRNNFFKNMISLKIRENRNN